MREAALVAEQLPANGHVEEKRDGFAILREAVRKFLANKTKGMHEHYRNCMVAVGVTPANLNLKLLSKLDSSVFSVLGNEIDEADADAVAQWALEHRVGSVSEIQAIINLTQLSAKSWFEFQLTPHGRWYPGRLESRIWRSAFGTACAVTVEYNVCDIGSQHRMMISSRLFETDDVKEERTLTECLEQYGLRPTTLEAYEENQKACLEAMRVNALTGRLMEMRGCGFYEIQSWFGGIGKVECGTMSCPGLGCVEMSLESGEWGEPQLPMVRLFDLSQKRYICCDVRDLEEHEYDKTVVERLVLPPDIEAPVKAVFHAKNDQMFGDLMKGRHGGMVILASGPPGVGKTFTAETFAESSERPLYVMGLGELGVNLEQVERSLKTIFERAARWNAVLLFDEAEIFLAKRDANLERSAIVGVFLRLLDYYRGMFFMTTNRPDVMDDAFRSRITLHLKYPDLNPNARLKIWREMFKASGIVVKGDEFDNSCSMAKELQINGRQIRNVCRLARVVYPNGEITMEELKGLVKLSTG